MHHNTMGGMGGGVNGGMPPLTATQGQWMGQQTMNAGGGGGGVDNHNNAPTFQDVNNPRGFSANGAIVARHVRRMAATGEPAGSTIRVDEASSFVPLREVLRGDPAWWGDHRTVTHPHEDTRNKTLMLQRAVTSRAEDISRPPQSIGVQVEMDAKTAVAPTTDEKARATDSEAMLRLDAELQTKTLEELLAKYTDRREAAEKERRRAADEKQAHFDAEVRNATKCDAISRFT
jgi:hypothetical protein